MIPISVMILTLNEESNLPGCLSSVAWSDDIHIIDSFSTDSTLEIARSHGARIWQRSFDSFAGQQNWALQNVDWKYPWVFYLDADERCTLDLQQAMQSAIRTPGETVAFQIQRRDFFMGRWLKHVQASPFYLRLFRPEKMSYRRLGHVISEPDGPTSRLHGYLDHFPFSKGLDDWFNRHNFYSRQEAIQSHLDRDGAVKFSLMKALFSRDFHLRRQHQKGLFYSLPFRPFIKFAYLLILKRGFLDGRAGFTYAKLMSMYESMILVKHAECKLLERSPDIDRPK